MNSELVWVICPVVAILSQLGGSYNKLFRRLGVPSIITLAAALFLGWSWWWPVLFLSVFGVTTLPVTLGGDEIKKWWQFLWLYLYAFLLMIPHIIIHEYVWICTLLCTLMGTIIVLSNIKATAKYFPWKFCEGIVYFLMAYPYALAIQLSRS